MSLHDRVTAWRAKSAEYLRKMKGQTPGNEGWYDGAAEAYGTCADELEAAIRLDSLRQVPEAKPLADRLPRESECTAEAAHHFYAQGWNACRDAIVNPASPTSGATTTNLPEISSKLVKATLAQAGAELPELPEPIWRAADDKGDPLGLFTADQMRAYAELARRGGSDG